MNYFQKLAFWVHCVELEQSLDGESAGYDNIPRKIFKQIIRNISAPITALAGATALSLDSP